MKKILKIVKDFGWNMAATFMCTAILQLVVYPLLAQWLDSEIYGELLTVMGIANIAVVTLGGGINNVRLIQNEKYQDHIEGDFNFLLGIVNIVGTILFGTIVLIFFPLTLGNFIIITAFVFLGILRGYWSVAYRLKINYVANFKMNLFISIGYIIGLFLVKVTHIWAFSFLIAEILGVIYLYITTDLYKESYKRTDLYKETFKVLIIIIINTLIGNIISYLDRLVLYPILGAKQVSIFTVSSFVGKSVGLLIIPISGVLLSYYAQKSFKMTLKRYWLINFIVIGGAVLSSGAVILFSPWATSVLYPTLLDQALRYLVIANMASLVGALSNIVSPAVLKYADVRWQLVIQVTYILIYFGLSILFLRSGGLYGFCIANLLVNTLRFMLYLLIGHVSIRRLEERE